MRWQECVGRIAKRLEAEPSIEGAFLGGSLVTGLWDEYSDVDLGIATGDTLEDLEAAYALRHELAGLLGTPAHYLERAWDHSRMIALLYGKGEYPPIGFEFDIIFSRLQDVAEQMPGDRFVAVLDRSGRLQPVLDQLGRARRESQVRNELLEQMAAFPFDANHAAKALVRGDADNYHFTLARLRAAVFSAAAGREGGVIRGCKRASRYLKDTEREAVQRSYGPPSPDVLQELVDLYLELLSEVGRQCGIEAEAAQLRRALREVSTVVTRD